MDFFATDTGERLGRISNVVAQPHEIWPDVNRRLVYMASTYRSGGYGSADRSHEVTVIDVDKHEIRDVIDIAPFVAPHDIEYNSSNDLVYVSVERNATGNNGIVIIDPKSRCVVGNIPTEGENSHWITISPDGARCYVAHKETPFLSVVDLEAREVIATVPVAGGAEEIAVSPDGAWLFANTPASVGSASDDGDHAGPLIEKVLKINTTDLTLAGYVELEPHHMALHVAADGKLLVSQLIPSGTTPPLSGGMRNGTLTLIDTESMTAINAIELERMPFTTRTSHDASVAYVANHGSGTVSVIDLPDLTLRDTWINTPPIGEGLGGTHGLALVPM